MKGMKVVMKYEELDIEKIKDMENLVQTVANNDLYVEKRFHVVINYCNKGDVGRIYTKEKNDISFGCKSRDEFMSNVVNIEIYDNFVELKDFNTGKTFQWEIDTRKMSDEEKILTALRLWNDYYLN